MISAKKRLAPIVCAILVSILYSCGGSGDSQVAEGGVGGTGVTQGRVTGFGSIFVNGIEYETGNTSFTVNSSDATQDDLAIGMVVKINGNSDATTATGEAVSVEYGSLIEGVVDTNNITTNDTLIVMGQSIVIDQDTVYENPFDATLLEALPSNSVVEVSGFTDGNGDILATRIEVKSLSWAGDTLKVTGIVRSISGTQIQIGDLVIEAADVLPIPSEGTYIEVEGNSFSGSVFEADAINIKGDGTIQVGEDGDEVEIEGRITSALDSQGQFALNGQPVDASATEFSGQTDLLTVGRIAEVEGIIEGSILIAEEIELKAAPSERGELAGILGVGNVDTTARTVRLLGQTIQINNSTIMENDLDDHESTFSLSQLAETDYLEAKIYSENGKLIATKLELDRSPYNHIAEVKGVPSYIDDSTLSIFGVIVDISGVEYVFSADIVTASGDYVDGVLVASRIEKDEDDDHHDHDEEEED